MEYRTGIGLKLKMENLSPLVNISERLNKGCYGSYSVVSVTTDDKSRLLLVRSRLDRHDVAELCEIVRHGHVEFRRL